MKSIDRTCPFRVPAAEILTENAQQKLGQYRDVQVAAYGRSFPVVLDLLSRGRIAGLGTADAGLGRGPQGPLEGKRAQLERGLKIPLLEMVSMREEPSEWAGGWSPTAN